MCTVPSFFCRKTIDNSQVGRGNPKRICADERRESIIYQSMAIREKK